MERRMLKKKPKSEARDRFLAEAKKHLGYRTRANGLSEFGARVGYSGHGIPWSGAFIDCVARDSGIFLPACVYSPTGLSEFFHAGRVVNRPEPGDIVFFAYPTARDFSMPHVGIVSDVDHWHEYESFMSIEANVNSGLPKAVQERDGIYERVHWKYETIAFARPDFEFRPGSGAKTLTGSKKVKLHDVQIGRRNRSVDLVQQALEVVAGLAHHEHGAFDGPTIQAYARWQRMTGHVGDDASGQPTGPSLERLGRETGIFEVDNSDLGNV
jgi:hypothetical protein